LAIVKLLFTGQFVPPAGAMIVVAAAITMCAFALFVGVNLAGSAALGWAGLGVFAMSLLPALASGVMPLRLVEPAFLLYGGGSLVSVLFFSRFIPVVVGWLRRKLAVPV
jgi:hypothetical protein